MGVEAEGGVKIVEPKEKKEENSLLLVEFYLFFHYIRAMDISVPTFPVRHCSLSLDVEGNRTEIIISRYEDHFLVIVTQIGSMGTILHARKEEGMSVHPTFNVSVTFGKRDEPMLVACARQLIEHMSSSGYSKGLVLSLGLRDHSVATLKHIVSAVMEKLPSVT